MGEARSNEHPEKIVRDALLGAARALDAGKLDEARDYLRSCPLVRCDRSSRIVAVALWQRILAGLYTPSIPRRRYRDVAAATLKRIVGHSPKVDGTVDERPRTISETLVGLSQASSNAGNPWKAYHEIPILEADLGAKDATAIVVTVLWDWVLETHPAVFESVFELFFRAGGERCVEAWEGFLAARPNYIPCYWHFLLLAKIKSGINHINFAEFSARSPDASERRDLAPLFEVYAKQMRQAPVSEIVDAALCLTAAGHRTRVADYMAEMAYMPEELPVIVSSFASLSGDSDTDNDAVNFMLARLANAQSRWRDVLSFTEAIGANSRHRHAATLLRAQALTRMHQTQDAVKLLDSVMDDKDASGFLHARATFIRVTTELVCRGLPLPEEGPLKIFPAAVGRPLAQSLWVGRKLRWIERLAIKSYLDNGWRFQLYVYDDVENVPEGCEILDASAIIPAKEVFKEGMGSGAHAGSIGAFSDLFRYQLLFKRGGMWTDTDVINFKRFEPDGQKFICTEISDAAVVTLNGAIMAAPAGDPFLARAYDRAVSLLSSSERFFFTRIGPYLLAELLIEMGVHHIELLPPGFLGPVSWLNAASLLQPFEVMMARQDVRQAVNLHVYTETWRALGLGLDCPPSPATFLGRLYYHHFGREKSSQEPASA